MGETRGFGGGRRHEGSRVDRDRGEYDHVREHERQRAEEGARESRTREDRDKTSYNQDSVRHNEKDLLWARIGFVRSLTLSPFRLAEAYLADLNEAPEERCAERLTRAFERTIKRARRLSIARAVVSVLLSFSVVLTAASYVTRVIWAPPELLALLEQIAAVAGSFAVVLFGIRLLLERYLHLFEVQASYTGMMIASAPKGTTSRTRKA